MFKGLSEKKILSVSDVVPTFEVLPVSEVVPTSEIMPVSEGVPTSEVLPVSEVLSLQRVAGNFRVRFIAFLMSIFVHAVLVGSFIKDSMEGGCSYSELFLMNDLDKYGYSEDELKKKVEESISGYVEHDNPEFFKEMMFSTDALVSAGGGKELEKAEKLLDSMIKELKEILDEEGEGKGDVAVFDKIAEWRKSFGYKMGQPNAVDLLDSGLGNCHAFSKHYLTLLKSVFPDREVKSVFTPSDQYGISHEYVLVELDDGKWFMLDGAKKIFKEVDEKDFEDVILVSADRYVEASKEGVLNEELSEDEKDELDVVQKVFKREKKKGKKKKKKKANKILSKKIKEVNSERGEDLLLVDVDFDGSGIEKRHSSDATIVNMLKSIDNKPKDLSKITSEVVDDDQKIIQLTLGKKPENRLENQLKSQFDRFTLLVWRIENLDSVGDEFSVPHRVVEYLSHNSLARDHLIKLINFHKNRDFKLKFMVDGRINNGDRYDWISELSKNENVSLQLVLTNIDDGAEWLSGYEGDLVLEGDNDISKSKGLKLNEVKILFFQGDFYRPSTKIMKIKGSGEDLACKKLVLEGDSLEPFITYPYTPLEGMKFSKVERLKLINFMLPYCGLGKTVESAKEVILKGRTSLTSLCGVGGINDLVLGEGLVNFNRGINVVNLHVYPGAQVSSGVHEGFSYQNLILYGDNPGDFDLSALGDTIPEKVFTGDSKNSDDFVVNFLNSDKQMLRDVLEKVLNDFSVYEWDKTSPSQLKLQEELQKQIFVDLFSEYKKVWDKDWKEKEFCIQRFIDDISSDLFMQFIIEAEGEDYEIGNELYMDIQKMKKQGE